MDTTQQMQCPSCHTVVLPSANFCSQCGKKIKEPPLSTSFGKQVVVYLISFFLAPFGLGYAVKYLRQRTPGARIIGVIALLLTICAIVLMVVVVKTFVGALYGSVETLTF